MLKYGSNHVDCFIRTLNVISEQQEALCYRRKCREQRIMVLNARFFDRTPCTSVLLLEGKSRDLIYLHIFKSVYLAIVQASYLPVPVAARSKAWVFGRRLLRLWVRIPPGAWMFVCCECCVLSGWSLVQGSPTDCGASLCVIKKPRKRGG